MIPTYKIRARALLDKDIEYLWEHLYGNITLIDDNNEETTLSYMEVLVSRYFWEIHRVYTDLPLLRRHYITEYCPNGTYKDSSNRKVASVILRDVVMYVLRQNATPVTIEPILKLIVEINNMLYNDAVRHLNRYVVSMDAVDFSELLANRQIDEVNKQVIDDPSQENLIKQTDVIMDVLAKDTSLDDNNLVKLFRAGSVNKNQVLQCVGSRGIVTELDNKSFKIPVSTGFAKGLTSIYDLAAESRSGAKALYFSDSALQDSEYFARRLQILTMSIMHVEPGDCGSTDYFLWKVRDKIVENGKVTYSGDLKYLVGKWYYDDEYGELRYITGGEEDTRLIGKTIKIRTPFRCKHPNKATVCSTCFGRMYLNIPVHTNLGHYSAVNMTQQTTQSVLSTKHIDFSEIMSKIILGTIQAKYLKTSKTGNGYTLNKKLPREDLKMYISTNELSGLANIHLTDDIKKLSPSRICRINTIILEYTDTQGLCRVPIDVYKDNRYALFTFDFLEYIKKKGYSSDNHGNIVFDMSEWGDGVFLELIDAQYSYADHRSKISQIIERAVNNLGDSDKELTPEYVTTELFDLVNSKLNVHISMLEIIMYAASIYSAEERNHDLSRGSDKVEVVNTAYTIRKRSLSAALGYEDVLKTLFDPTTYYPDNKPNHPMDCFFMPQEVYEDETRIDR